jgi:Mevalonate pyrophosphate decarboxylase
VRVYAPINIALVKYWGKASEDPVLPSTPSISLTLEDLGSETTLEKSDAFKFTLNGTPLQGEALEKMRTFFRLFNADEQVHISSVNTAPTAAGVASSASGFAALSRLLKETYTPDLAFEPWVKRTAYGSGSATRSLLGGAVMWHENGHVSQVPFHAEHYQMAVVMIDTPPKKVSSRAQMKQSLTHPNFHDWQRRNRDRAEPMIQAMAADDFKAMGTLMDLPPLTCIASLPYPGMVSRI